MPNSNSNTENFDLKHLPLNNPQVVGVDVQEVIDPVDNDGKIKQVDDNRCNRKESSKEGNNTESPIAKDNENQSNNIGVCRICCDYLGKKPLGSTICGHVFCMECLEQTLKHQEHCPTCNCILKGEDAYHRLYLQLGADNA